MLACQGSEIGRELFSVNEEFLVVAGHQPAANTSLPFVHTARRYYQWNGLVRPADRAVTAARDLGARSGTNLTIYRK